MSGFGCFNLKDAVMVAPHVAPRAHPHDGHGSAWKAGIVTGRTLEQNPRYDVRFFDGTVELNIAAARIRPRDSGRNERIFSGKSGGRDRD